MSEEVRFPPSRPFGAPRTTEPPPPRFAPDTETATPEPAPRVAPDDSAEDDRPAP